MTAWILAAVVGWPLLLGAALADSASAGPHRWSAVVYLAASRVCHQRAERSFRSAGVQWPVCGRCAGGYLGAFAIAPFAVALSRRLRRDRAARFLVAAAAPSILTMLVEWAGAPVTNGVRALAAAPAGVAVVIALLLALRAWAAEPIR